MARGEPEEIRVLDDYVCTAIPDPDPETVKAIREEERRFAAEEEAKAKATEFKPGSTPPSSKS
jgi:hypothetical protein